MSYPIKDLFAWVVDDPSGEHAIMGVMMPTMPMQAVSSKRANMELSEIAQVAELSAKALGFPVRLQRYTLAETLQTFEP
jgi:hypothetical protein